jgi:hypothetical protein
MSLLPKQIISFVRRCQHITILIYLLRFRPFRLHVYTVFHTRHYYGQDTPGTPGHPILDPENYRVIIDIVKCKVSCETYHYCGTLIRKFFQLLRCDEDFIVHRILQYQELDPDNFRIAVRAQFCRDNLILKLS